MTVSIVSLNQELNNYLANISNSFDYDLLHDLERNDTTEFLPTTQPTNPRRQASQAQPSQNSSQTTNESDSSAQEATPTTRTQQENYINSHYIGNEIDGQKPTGIYRLYFCNPNGLTLGPDGGDYAEFCTEMHKIQADSWGIAEINLDTNRTSVKECLYRTNRKQFDFAKMTYGSSTIPSRRHDYKPGGTLLASQGHITSRIIHQESDYMGRWSYQILSGRMNRTITLISAYQVCNQTITSGDNRENRRIASYTTTAQQTSMLRQEGRTCTPREAFIEDLSQFIRSQQEQQSTNLLVGDFNEPLSDSGEGISRLASELNLIDVMKERLGSTNFATYIRGRERIDFCLASTEVFQALHDACYEPFEGRLAKSDHRGMILDFNSDLLFGNTTQCLAPLPVREFTIKDRKAVCDYVQAKHRYLQEHKYAERLAKAKRYWSPRIQERLDTDFQRASIFAAKQCTKKPNIAYSNELARLCRYKNIVLKVISSMRLQRPFDPTADCLYREGDNFHIPESLDECQKLCRDLQKKIKEVTADATFKRQNEQQIKLRDAQQKGDRATAKRMKVLMAAERTKEMYRKIRNCRGNTKSGITRLDVPTDPDDTNYKACVDWVTIDTPEAIEARLLQRNQRHFGQASGTFPTTPPFSEWVDWGASSHTAELILEGTWQSTEIDSISQDVISHMKARTTLDEIKDTLTVEEWVGKIRSWPEQTTTSPSGFHLSHSKALVVPLCFEEDDKDTAQIIEQQRSDLIEWQVDLLNLAISNKYCMERWKSIVNVMILKEPNNHRIHRLRVIHLYEQDYNLILAIKWRQMIQNCSNNQLLHPGQFGAVPGKDAILPTLIEEFHFLRKEACLKSICSSHVYARKVYTVN